ncbi:hypothetical protein K1F50_11450 [Muricauda oceani]|uniref:Uncharacterized protein n=1 Tax=Flagellimonas oceani TaxID=2698672 RepID=A0A6G7J491_9FLAO|nr:hypothetical protein [Allomuricauda oceani]MBW8243418.1 hypothetical protein [Allomuricauda oceani]QII45635.1 hypothetical protein GVT53_13430 [Allomuricauda oceani]
MKKFSLTLILLATMAIVLGGMYAFQGIDRLDFISKAKPPIQTDTVYAAKYNDCITEQDLPDGFATFTHDITHQYLQLQYDKVNESARKYGISLDSTLKNLSTVDAHDFIHKTFKDARNAAEKEGISEIQRHYQFEIMRMCLEKDRRLNKNVVGIL